MRPRISLHLLQRKHGGIRMKRRPTILQTLLLSLGLLLALFAQPAMSTRAEAEVQHVVFNDSFTGLIADSPCANDGAGETIVFDAELHGESHYTGTAAGFTNMIYNDNERWQGVGLTTGERYVGGSRTHEVQIFQDETTTTFIRATITLIGTGPDQSRLVFNSVMQLHMVGGELVLDRTSFSSDCQ